MIKFFTQRVLKLLHIFVKSSYNFLMVFYNARKITRNLGF